MMQLGGRFIGDGNKTFITFEAGPTHTGYQSAKNLIKAAAGAGADAVKFQIFDPDELIADKELIFSYEILIDKKAGTKKIVSEPLFDIFERRRLSNKEWISLKAYADSFNLCFFATIGDEQGYDLVKNLGCETVKVASADLNYTPWLRKIAKLGIPVQLDTGSSTFGEIEAAIDVLREESCDQIIIHNCPSGYPASLESINLKIIPSLKTMFGFPVAYSDHSFGSTMNVAAVAMGANMIEKTITEDRCTPSVEHIMSLEVKDLPDFVSEIRNVEAAMGNSRRVMSFEEKQMRLSARRSLVIDQDVKIGDKLLQAKVKFLRPGFGISPDIYEDLLEKEFLRPLVKGTVVKRSDLS